VTDNLLDLTVGLEVVEGFPGERTVDLETIDEGGDGDQAVRLDILVEPVGNALVEDDSVLGLVLDCAAVSYGPSEMRAVRGASSVCKAGGRLCASRHDWRRFGGAGF
jgi:hypothetical protein